MSQCRANSPGQRPAPVFQEALPVIGHCTDVNELSFILQCRKTLHFTSQRNAGLSKPLPTAKLGYLWMLSTNEMHHKHLQDLVPEQECVEIWGINAVYP